MKNFVDKENIFQKKKEDNSKKVGELEERIFLKDLKYTTNNQEMNKNVTLRNKQNKIIQVIKNK